MNKRDIERLRKRDRYCWHCGEDVDLVPHHRKNRGMGGRPSLDVPQNVIMVCAIYNGLMESNAGTAELANDYGHKLRQWQDFEQPCFDVPSGTWYRLERNFTKTQVETPSTLLF